MDGIALSRLEVLECSENIEMIGSGLFTCAIDNMDERFQGSCLCSAVRYELLTSPKAVSHCHCSQCRKGHGAAFASYGSVPRNALRIVEGAASIKAFASSKTVLREFCGECGSSLFWSSAEGQFANWVSVALGTLDTPFVPGKQKHVYAESLVDWYMPLESGFQGD